MKTTEPNKSHNDEQKLEKCSPDADCRKGHTLSVGNIKLKFKKIKEKKFASKI